MKRHYTRIDNEVFSELKARKRWLSIDYFRVECGRSGIDCLESVRRLVVDRLAKVKFRGRRVYAKIIGPRCS